MNACQPDVGGPQRDLLRSLVSNPFSHRVILGVEDVALAHYILSYYDRKTL